MGAILNSPIVVQYQPQIQRRQLVATGGDNMLNVRIEGLVVTTIDGKGRDCLRCHDCQRNRSVDKASIHQGMLPRGAEDSSVDASVEPSR